jgi:hypothetical protein
MAYNLYNLYNQCHIGEHSVYPGHLCSLHRLKPNSNSVFLTYLHTNIQHMCLLINHIYRRALCVPWPPPRPSLSFYHNLLCHTLFLSFNHNLLLYSCHLIYIIYIIYHIHIYRRALCVPWPPPPPSPSKTQL